jgi:hypothetical protein
MVWAYILTDGIILTEHAYRRNEFTEMKMKGENKERQESVSKRRKLRTEAVENRQRKKGMKNKGRNI